MSDQQTTYDFHKLVREAAREADELYSACHPRRFLFWRFARDHEFGKWDHMLTQKNRSTRRAELLMGRRCDRCGALQMKTQPVPLKPP